MRRSMNIIGLVFGAMFGFVLAAGRLHDYDTIHATLRLESFYVFGLMGLAIGISAPLLWLLERRQLATPYGGVLSLARSKVERHHIHGGALFGAGWSIAGTCPAPALAMLASGAGYGAIAVVGEQGVTDVEGERTQGGETAQKCGKPACVSEARSQLQQL